MSDSSSVFHEVLIMKTKGLVLAVLSLGLLALAAAGQTPVIRGPKPSKAITISGSGNQVVILQGNLEASNVVAAMASRANVFVSGRSTLAPGQVVFLGPTGPAASSTAVDMVVVSPRAGAAASPLSATIQQQVFLGDLVRATPGPGGLTDQTGGFVFGANGFPVAVTAAPNGAATLAIGPNGFPTLGSPTPTIDTNGFPAGTGTAFPQTSLTTTAGSATTIVVPARARTTTVGAAAPTRGAAGSAATR